MSFNQSSATERAKQDLAQRLGIAESEIGEKNVESADFPDSALGAPIEDEMSAQMISSGWRIILSANSENYEYRADKYSLRLFNFKGTNHIVVS